MSVKVEVPMIGLQVSELRQSTTVILNVICQYRFTHDAVCVTATLHNPHLCICKTWFTFTISFTSLKYCSRFTAIHLMCMEKSATF